jgi:hypothetical protein
MLAAAGHGLLDAHRQSRWKPVEAKPVIATSASNQTFRTFLEGLDSRSRARRHFGVKVLYKYSVGGRDFEGQSVSGRMTEEQAKIEAGAFPLADAQRLRRPTDPAKCARARERRFIVLLPLRRRRRRRALFSAEASLPEPLPPANSVQ